MLRSIILGLGLAGLAFWAGNRAAGIIAPGTTVKGPAGGAHSPDGQDASASFAAGIADENSIPDAQPA